MEMVPSCIVRLIREAVCGIVARMLYSGRRRSVFKSCLSQEILWVILGQSPSPSLSLPPGVVKIKGRGRAMSVALGRKGGIIIIVIINKNNCNAPLKNQCSEIGAHKFTTMNDRLWWLPAAQSLLLDCKEFEGRTGSLLSYGAFQKVEAARTDPSDFPQKLIWSRGLGGRVDCLSEFALEECHSFGMEVRGIFLGQIPLGSEFSEHGWGMQGRWCW